MGLFGLKDSSKSNNSKTGIMPTGLSYIVVNEAAERYSFYGMKGILTVFMTGFLVERSGELDIMTGNEANIWYHTFVMGVYFLPLFGALLSDIFLGKYRTIIGLSLVYCLGHLVLAFDQTRLGLGIGLGLIAMGAGGIKPCVSAHLGDQFDDSNKHLLEQAYSWFYFAINIGSAMSMILGEWLLQKFGAHIAFGIPGVLMLIATLVFWYGRRSYVSMPAAGLVVYKRDLFSKEGFSVVFRLLPVFAMVAVFWSLYDQTGSSWIQQASSDLVIKKVNLGFTSFTLLPSQVQSVNPILILLFIPLFAGIIYPMVSRMGIKLSALRKIGAGLVLAASAFAVITFVEARVFNGLTVNIGWQVLAYVLLTAAEVLISLTCLEFSYTQAPNSMKSFIMGLYFCSLAAGNFITVEVNHWMQDPVEIMAVSTGSQTFIQVDGDIEVQNGRKFMLQGDQGLIRTIEGDEVRMQGTFIMGESRTDGSFEILDAVNRDPVMSKGAYATIKGSSTYINKLIGPAYFRFFTVLMLCAFVLFLPISRFYKGKSYMQDHKQADTSI